MQTIDPLSNLSILFLSSYNAQSSSRKSKVGLPISLRKTGKAYSCHQSWSLHNADVERSGLEQEGESKISDCLPKDFCWQVNILIPRFNIFSLSNVLFLSFSTGRTPNVGSASSKENKIKVSLSPIFTLSMVTLALQLHLFPKQFFDFHLVIREHWLLHTASPTRLLIDANEIKLLDYFFASCLLAENKML